MRQPLRAPGAGVLSPTTVAAATAGAGGAEVADSLGADSASSTRSESDREKTRFWNSATTAVARAMTTTIPTTPCHGLKSTIDHGAGPSTVGAPGAGSPVSRGGSSGGSLAPSADRWFARGDVGPLHAGDAATASIRSARVQVSTTHAASPRSTPRRAWSWSARCGASVLRAWSA